MHVGFKRSRGFTLIELVLVLVLLGVLGAVALPKFIDLRGDAFKQVVNTTASSLQTSANAARMLCMTRNWAGRNNLPGYGDGTVDFSSTCWPMSSGTAVPSTGRLRPQSCVSIFQGVMSTSVRVGIATTSNPDFLVTVSGSGCIFTYHRDTIDRWFEYEPGTGSVVNMLNP